jgi:hypothetical protein
MVAAVSDGEVAASPPGLTFRPMGDPDLTAVMAVEVQATPTPGARRFFAIACGLATTPGSCRLVTAWWATASCQ